MFPAFLFEHGSRTRLRQRRVLEGDRVTYRLRDGSGFVALSLTEWSKTEDSLNKAVARSGKRLRWALNLAIPFSILLMCFYSAILPVKAAIDWLDHNLWGAGYLVMIFGMPITMVAIHNRTVQRAMDAIEARLARKPRFVPPVGPSRRALNGLEMLALLIAGPQLVIDIVGTITPEVFRNTPLVGSELGVFSGIALAVLAGIVALRWREKRRSWAPESTEKTERRTDVIGRTRSLQPE